MYFLSGEAICATVSPAFRAASSNWGTGVAADADGFCWDSFDVDFVKATCADNVVDNCTAIDRVKPQERSKARIGKADYTRQENCRNGWNPSTRNIAHAEELSDDVLAVIERSEC